MKMHLQIEIANNTSAWFERVPTEANIADFPSRFQLRPFLEDGSDDSNKAADHIQRFIGEVDGAKEMKKKKGEVDHLATPQLSKK